jgi:hypothetical protein
LRRDEIFQNAFSHRAVYINDRQAGLFGHVLNVCGEKPIPLKQVADSGDCGQGFRLIADSDSD